MHTIPRSLTGDPAHAQDYLNTRQYRSDPSARTYLRQNADYTGACDPSPLHSLPTHSAATTQDEYAYQF